MSVIGGGKESAAIKEAMELMPTQELAILYYLTNLVLLEDYRVVVSLITKKILKMAHITSNLRGSCLRLKALCQFEILRVQVEDQLEKKSTQKQFKPGQLQRQLKEIYDCLT